MIYKLSIEFDRKTALTTFRPEISKKFNSVYFRILLFSHRFFNSGLNPVQLMLKYRDVTVPRRLSEIPGTQILLS